MSKMQARIAGKLFLLASDLQLSLVDNASARCRT